MLHRNVRRGHRARTRIFTSPKDAYAEALLAAAFELSVVHRAAVAT